MMDQLPEWAGTVPGWIAAISTTGVFGVAVTAMLKLIPVWRQMSINDATTKRGEKRADRASCEERLDRMGEKLERVQREMHNFELKLLATLSAYRILDAEIEKSLPDSSALAQARSVLSAAYILSPSVPDDILRAAEQAR